ncbi:diuretic hormone receptor-like isoform X1 [Diorhabda sublineata]|uniref:diuretic hormone receptor-like isoform X1 n=1 Tax=Diorhabda sublineata TaxID=1163346 RepID=UPI0024E189DE|nr:diuretic hormone receptor-like isoform X1 [Diorhabda sublineata]
MSWGQELGPIDHDAPNLFVYTPNGNSSGTMYDDYDYESGFFNLTLDDCKEQYAVRSLELSNTHKDKFCKVTFDSIACWPPTLFNETATISCFSELFHIKYDSSQNATRFCHANGTWSKQNFSMCKELIEIPENTSTQADIYFVGFTLSLITLTIAVGIFMCFKDLRCLRNKIHINLMWSYILMYCTWIVMLMLIKYRYKSIVLCRFGTMLLHYSHASTFFWMFVEGMYLYTLVVRTMRRKSFKLRVYVSIGWGIPLLFIILWGVLKGAMSDSNDENECPWLQNDSLDWIYLAPSLLVIFVNLAFLFSIMWVLITKLRSSPAVIEHQQHYKAARALLILMPLLGVTWVITIYVPSDPTETQIFQIAQTALLSTQGLMIALFYCFLNTEVQATIKHHYDNWKARRSFESNNHRKSNGLVSHSRHTEWTLINSDEPEALSSEKTNNLTTLSNIPDVPTTSEVPDIEI